MKCFELRQEVITPDGKAIIILIDHLHRSVRVRHLESKTSVTDYRFDDLKQINQ